MKVLLINGSPHKDGCTMRALEEVASELNKNSVETEFFHIGTKPVAGCIACGNCRKTGSCIFSDDGVNHCNRIMKDCQGLIIGAPVHYASPAGAATAFFDRLFYSGSSFAFKPGAAVVSARRAGTTASLDMLNKYFLISQMPLVSSSYWNMVHGSDKSDVEKDEEGLQTMRQLGRNMAWMLKLIKAGLDSGISLPGVEDKIRTNFIR